MNLERCFECGGLRLPLVRMTESLWIRQDTIAEVQIQRNDNRVMVRLTNGETHYFKAKGTALVEKAIELADGAKERLPAQILDSAITTVLDDPIARLRPRVEQRSAIKVSRTLATHERVLSTLRSSSLPLTASQVAQRLGISYAWTMITLQTLCAKRSVERAGYATAMGRGAPASLYRAVAP